MTYQEALNYLDNVQIDMKSIEYMCEASDLIETCKKGKPILFQPVDGWTAEKIYRRYTNGYIMATYSITACPEFIPDEPRKTQDVVDGK